MLIKKSAEIYIALNAKDQNGKTGFHLACQNSRLSIVEMMLKEAKSFKLELTMKDNDGRSGFQLAKELRKFDVVKLIRKNMPSIATKRWIVTDT